MHGLLHDESGRATVVEIKSIQGVFQDDWDFAHFPFDVQVRHENIMAIMSCVRCVTLVDVLVYDRCFSQFVYEEGKEMNSNILKLITHHQLDNGSTRP